MQIRAAAMHRLVAGGAYDAAPSERPARQRQQAQMPRPSTLAPFRIRSYRFQWPADLLTSWAFEMEMLILGWYVLVETGSVLMLTIYAALLSLGTLIAPALGVASDRIGHRQLLCTMRLIYAGVALTVMTLAFSGALNPIAVLGMAAISGLVRPSDLGLRGALIAETMPAPMLTSAMGVSRTTSDSARIAGALAGAGIAATFGMGQAYVVIATFYLCAALLTWMAVMKAPAHDPEPNPEPTSPWRDLKAGVVHIWNTPSLLALVWLALLFNFTAFPLTHGLLPYVAKSVYLTDQTGLGYLVASISFGAMLGGLSMTLIGAGGNLARLMFVSALIWHGLLIVFAQMQAMVPGIAVLLVTGVFQSLTMVAHTVLLLQLSTPRFRGRIMGVRMLMIYSLPVGLLIAGALIERVGFRATATTYAAIGLVFSLVIAARYWSSLRRAS
jgi:hypothetical protein